MQLRINIRPKLRRGPAKGVTAALLLTISVGVLWLGYVALADAGIIRELNMLELAAMGIVCGLAGSLLAFIINRNLYLQGRRPHSKGGDTT